MHAVRTISYADRRVVLDCPKRIVCEFDEVHLMMACPIPDMHGRQLYESDLVFDYWADDKRLMKIVYTPDVGWDVADFQNPEDADFIIGEDSKHLEYAGNIYEHSALLAPKTAPKQTPQQSIPRSVIAPAVPDGDKKRAVLDALPGILTEPMSASEIAGNLAFPISNVYLYLMLKKQPGIRTSQKRNRKGKPVTAFELIPTAE